jgi:glycosyltransferase involved in cell wall biosynthesis
VGVIGTSMGTGAPGPLLSIVVPMKNEEDAVVPFLARMKRVLDGLRLAEGWEIVFVDDGSSDHTLALVLEANRNDARIRGLSLSRNFGKEAALTAGLDFTTGQVVVPIDVDMQDPPEVIGEMIAKWRTGYEVVYGVRRSRESDGIAKRMTADWYYRARNWLSKDKIPMHAGDFRLLDRRVIEVIKAMPERNRFMKGLFSWSGFRTAAVEYDRVEREHGATKYNYFKLWSLALDGITSGSTVPLKMWSYVGGGIAFVAMLYAFFIVVRTLLFGNGVPGYASLITAVLFLGGLQLLSLGVLGEYVGRILIEVKGRPIYVIQQKIGLD